MIFLSSGADGFRRQIFRRGLLAKARAKNPALVVERIFCNLDEEPLARLGDLITPSLFGNKIFVVLLGAETIAAELQAFFKRHNHLATDEDLFVLVELGTTLDKDVKTLVASLVKTAVLVKKFKDLNRAELTNWLREYALRNEIEVEPAALRHIVESVQTASMAPGERTWQAVSALERCAGLEKNRSVTLVNVLEHVALAPESRLFNLLDALGARSTPAALRALGQEYAAGTNEFLIIAMLQYQLRLLGLARAALETNTGANLAKVADLKPFVAQKALKAAARFKTFEIQDLYGSLIKTHQALRRDKTAVRLNLERFVIKFAGGV